jgi:hypothetical protein
MKYTLELTEKQLGIIQYATDLIARLGIGQVKEAFEHLPLNNDCDWSTFHNDVRDIEHIISKHTIGNVDGYRSSLGIHNDKVKLDAKIAWEIHQVIRHRLSWDRAIAKGFTDGKARNWSEMMGVCYDEPFPCSGEALPVISKED